MAQALKSKPLRRKAGATFTLTAVLSCLFLTAAVMPQDADRSHPGSKLTFPVAARLVQVSVLVHDKKGAPVTGLTASDFQLFEQGKEQSIETFTVESEVESAVSSARATRGPQTEFSNQNEGRGGEKSNRTPGGRCISFPVNVTG